MLLEPHESVKLLGFRIDGILKFDNHIDTISKSTGKQLSVLSKDVGQDENTHIRIIYNGKYVRLPSNLAFLE